MTSTLIFLKRVVDGIIMYQIIFPTFNVPYFLWNNNIYFFSI